MVGRRGFVVGLLLLAVSGSAYSAEQRARDFVAAIYANYTGRDAKGTSLSKRGEPGRYFTPALARMIDGDARAAAKRGEVGLLGADPFIDAQDFEIKDFAIDVKETGHDKAVAIVAFKNLDANVKMTLDLVKQNEGWRIDDIRGPSGSLRAQFKKK